jgi:hypothetical protein
VRRRLAVLHCVLAGAVLIGCGNQRAKPPNLEAPKPPDAMKRFVYEKAQLEFSAPRNWSQREDSPPRVALVSSGAASVVIWRYRRRGRLPESGLALEGALAALADAVRAHDRDAVVRSTRVVTVGDVPGIELVADQVLFGERRRVRSRHLFARGAEYVIDASAPPDSFARVDRTVFAPLMASVQVRPTAGART